MNSLAAVHLRQARAFLRAGDPRRAVELLEKARALARDDRQMLLEILEALSVAYREVGSPEKGEQCQAQLGRLSGAVAGGGEAFVKGNKSKSVLRWFAAAAAIILLAAAVIFATRKKLPPPMTVIHIPVPATLPAAAIVATPIPHPHPATTRSVHSLPAMAKVDVRPSVALLVLLGHYEGLANGEHLQVYVPLSSGAAFVVKRTGILLSVRHLTHLAKENNFPSTLESLKLPTVTLRDIGYVACFSSDSSDWIDARLLYENEQYDVAVLSTDRHFPGALDDSGRDAVRGEILSAWSYPAVLTFNNSYADAVRVDEMIRALPKTQSVNLLAAVAAKYFIASSVPGRVVIPERNVDGTACVELGIKPAGDNGGGPMVDSMGRAIAIAEPAGKQPGNAVGILLNQLQDEIAPYLAPIRATSSAAAVRHNDPRNAYNQRSSCTAEIFPDSREVLLAEFHNGSLAAMARARSSP